MIHVHIETRILSDQLSQLLHISLLDSSQHDNLKPGKVEERRKKKEKKGRLESEPRSSPPLLLLPPLPLLRLLVLLLLLVLLQDFHYFKGND